jgi:hypothetical protein
MAKRTVIVTAVVPSPYGGHLALGATKRNATFFPHGQDIELEVEMDDKIQIDEVTGKPVLDEITGEPKVFLQADYKKLVANPNLRVKFKPTAAELRKELEELEAKEEAEARAKVEMFDAKRAASAPAKGDGKSAK